MASRKDYPVPSVRTPGPWTARATMSGVTICNPDGVAVAKTPCCDRQALADGALLAASPELLEQLTLTMTELVRLHAQSSGNEAKRIWDTIDRASFAIAKAEARPS
jgi:hypothetical protein